MLTDIVYSSFFCLYISIYLIILVCNIDVTCTHILCYSIYTVHIYIYIYIHIDLAGEQERTYQYSSKGGKSGPTCVDWDP